MSTVPRKVFIQVDTTEEQVIVYKILLFFFVGYNLIYSYSIMLEIKMNIIIYFVHFFSFQENIKNARKTLKVLQKGATDKENLIGRPAIEKTLFKKSKS